MLLLRTTTTTTAAVATTRRVLLRAATARTTTPIAQQQQPHQRPYSASTRAEDRIVIAVGGNALQRRGERLTIENMLKAAADMAPTSKWLVCLLLLCCFVCCVEER